ncbi:MAG TPA: glycosyltransferase family 4 protein [Phycisphaerae bacterium]|nr:glycosyltransferase family 4 protein [Phycisphaerae bacterium]
MNIAFIIMDLELGGGAEHDIINLSTGMKKAGHSPAVITSGGRLCEYLETEGVTLVRLPVNQRSPLQLWRNAESFARTAERHEVEILNPQGVYPAVSCYWASRRLLRRGKFVPNVVTIHMLGRLTWWYYGMGAMLLNHYADHVIFESECELNRLKARGFSGPYTVIPNCFPPSKLAAVTESRAAIRRDIGVPDDAVLFIMPARMTPEKRHDLLLETLARPEVRELPIRFFLAGDGPLLDQCKRRAGELGLAEKVIFGGFRKDVPRLYKAADVFLLCSSNESLPLSIREGMGASLPVIATHVGGIAEAVEDGRSGLMVPSGDSDALAGAIRKLATDAALRTSLGARGLEIYRTRFDYNNWIRRTVEVTSAVREEFIRTHR